MAERKKVSQLRKEIKDQFGDDVYIKLIPDVYRGGKRDIDFFTLFYNIDDACKLPIFLAWEAKEVKGSTFNMKEVAEHQLHALKTIPHTSERKHSIIPIFFPKHDNCIVILDINSWTSIFTYGKEHSFKILEFLPEDNEVVVKSGNKGYMLPCIFRRKIYSRMLDKSVTQWDIKPYIYKIYKGIYGI